MAIERNVSSQTPPASRVIEMPGIRLGRNLSDWLGLKPNSPGLKRLKDDLREVDQTERNARLRTRPASETVIIRSKGR